MFKISDKVKYQGKIYEIYGYISKIDYYGIGEVNLSNSNHITFRTIGLFKGILADIDIDINELIWLDIRELIKEGNVQLLIEGELKEDVKEILDFMCTYNISSLKKELSCGLSLEYTYDKSIEMFTICVEDVVLVKSKNPFNLLYYLPKEESN